MTKNDKWQWEISYEESDDGQLGHLPLVHVPPDELMPTFLLVWEARDTGEIEPDDEGEDVPIVEWDLRQYARMDILKEKLPTNEFDNVRLALGLEPLIIATEKGQKISNSVKQTIENSKK